MRRAFDQKKCPRCELTELLGACRLEGERFDQYDEEHRCDWCTGGSERCDCTCRGCHLPQEFREQLIDEASGY